MSIDGETLSHRVHRTSVFGKRCVDFGFNVGADGSNTWTDAGQVGGFYSSYALQNFYCKNQNYAPSAALKMKLREGETRKIKEKKL